MRRHRPLMSSGFAVQNSTAYILVSHRHPSGVSTSFSALLTSPDLSFARRLTASSDRRPAGRYNILMSAFSHSRIVLCQIVPDQHSKPDALQPSIQPAWADGPAQSDPWKKFHYVTVWFRACHVGAVVAVRTGSACSAKPAELELGMVSFSFLSPLSCYLFPLGPDRPPGPRRAYFAAWR